MHLILSHQKYSEDAYFSKTNMILQNITSFRLILFAQPSGVCFISRTARSCVESVVCEQELQFNMQIIVASDEITSLVSSLHSCTQLLGVGWGEGEGDSV